MDIFSVFIRTLREQKLKPRQITRDRLVLQHRVALIVRARDLVRIPAQKLLEIFLRIDAHRVLG